MSVQSRTLLKNTGFSLFADVVNRSSNTLLWIIIARFLGSEAAGAMTLALTYTFLATRISFWGLDQLLTREVARDFQSAKRYTSTFLAVRAILAVLATLVLVGIVQAAPYPVSTKWIIWWLSLTVLPENLTNICQAVFMAHERMRYLATLELFLSVVKIVLGTVVLGLGWSATAVVWILVLDSFLGLAINLWLTTARFDALAWAVDWRFGWEQLWASTPFFFSGLLYILDSRVDVILLSLFRSESDVGVYGAAANLVMLLMLVPQAYRSALFAPLSRLYVTARSAAEQLFDQSFKYLVLAALPLTVGGALLARPFIILLYKREFLEAAAVLPILMFPTTFLFVNVLFVRMLIAADRQWVVARTLIFSLVLNVVLNLLLVPRLGVPGVAWARFASGTAVALLNFGDVYRQIYQVRWWPLVWRPVLAAALMGSVIYWFPESLWPLTVVVGAGIYLGVVWGSGALPPAEVQQWKRLLRGSRERS